MKNERRDLFKKPRKLRHPCAVPNCRKSVRMHVLMCGTHWSKVDEATKGMILHLDHADLVWAMAVRAAVAQCSEKAAS